MSHLTIGDMFNETDDDTEQRVIEIREKNDPPTVLVRSLKKEEESDSTEEEYALEYVRQAVKSRKLFRAKYKRISRSSETDKKILVRPPLF